MTRRQTVAMRFTGALITALALLMCGCASTGGSVSIADWKDNVEQYVKDHGDDPSVLRDVRLPGDRPGFGAIGAPDPQRSTDVFAVLLGHRVIQDKPWFIYLVGRVKSEKVEQIRVAALWVREGRFNWKLGPPSTSSLEQYRSFANAQWHQRFPNRATPPPAYTTFPRADDAFDLSISGDQIVATHRQSGARWELWLDHHRGSDSSKSRSAATPANPDARHASK